MRARRTVFKPAGILVLAIIAVMTLTGSAWPVTYKVLYKFGSYPDAQSPEAGLVFDSVGNLYGTTFNGGTSNVGAVYELSPVPGGWTEKVLYSFTGKADGGRPVSTLVLDAKGNLYGTTEYGGTGNGGLGNGVVFELSPPAHGHSAWTEKVIHTFAGGTDGVAPLGGVIFDGNGNLIGTTSAGGSTNLGTIFELSPSNGTWSKSSIHIFQGGNDNSVPQGKLTIDSLGRVYGTTRGGVGSIYRLTRNSNGNWIYHQMYCFCNEGGGISPYGGLAVDNSFHIYGTTYGGFGTGNVFEFALPSPIQIKVMNGTTDGGGPLGGVVLDTLGHLWGTASFGGDHGVGVVFNAAYVAGKWQYTVAHNFGGISNSDGATPITDLIFDTGGHLYGTTYSGGATNVGEVFEVIP